MSTIKDFKTTLRVKLKGEDNVITIKDEGDSKYATNALNAFRQNRLIETKADLGMGLMDVYAYPENVIYVVATREMEDVEYTDDVCPSR